MGNGFPGPGAGRGSWADLGGAEEGRVEEVSGGRCLERGTPLGTSVEMRVERRDLREAIGTLGKGGL